MPLSEQLISDSVDRYWREFDRYEKLASFVAEKCRQLVDSKLIRATISYRAKDPERLRGKLRKYLRTQTERDSLDNIDEVFIRVGDFAGVRIATYVEKDREKIQEGLKTLFVGSPYADIQFERKDNSTTLYRATHCQVALPEEDLIGTYSNLKGLACEIQICSLLAHVFNEIEHDIRYKQLSGEISEKEGSLLDALGKLTASGDVLIETIFEAQESRQKEIQDDFEDEYDFVVRMRAQFNEATNFSYHAYQLYEELLAFGLDSPAKIGAKLLTGDYIRRSAELMDRLQSVCEEDSPRIVSVDKNSSDCLLVLLFEKHANEIEELHPVGRGKGRPSRIRSLATRFIQMRESASTD